MKWFHWFCAQSQQDWLAAAGLQAAAPQLIADCF